MIQATPKVVRQVVVDLGRNTLVLIVEPIVGSDSGATRNQSGTIDVGTRGRLIGVELDTEYFAVAMTEGSTDNLIRSIEVAVNVNLSADGRVLSIELSRHSSNYEVTFPIGNQCWQQAVNGSVVESCVVTVSRDS